MVEHIVLITWKEDVTNETRNQILAELLTLKDKILGIVSYHVGHNFSSRSQGFDAAITSTFVDEKSLEAYSVHKEHVAIAQKLRTSTKNILALDFHHLSA